MRNYIKNHWFGTIMTIIVVLFIAEFFLILYAPHQDENGRGFSVCSQKMVEDVYNCNQKTWCVFKSVSKNYICYNKVIYKGFKNWVVGDSKTPWSEYYYSETVRETPSELEEFYSENPNVVEQMELLKQQNLELEKIYNEDK